MTENCLKCPHYNHSQKKDTLGRLRALWYILIKELADDTGYSKIFWKQELKKVGGFFEVISEPNGKYTKEFKSVGNAACTLNALSQLFEDSFDYIRDNEIIDLTNFITKYEEITGNSLV